MKIVVVDSATDDMASDTEIFRKVVTIKKTQPPTPDKLIIDGHLFSKQPERPQRVRVRKQEAPRSSTYQPVPYVPGPPTTWVPERKEVLVAAEAWSR